MKTILITGATDGIGRQTAMELATMNYRVLIHGRNEIRGKETVAEIRDLAGNPEVFYYNADLTDLTAVERLAHHISSDYDVLDVLINNAGVFENHKHILRNGFEKTFVVNHLAHFALTLHLLELLKRATECRIVNVSSQAQAGTIDFDNLNGDKYYDAYNAYALSKLENILFTYKLAEQLKNTNITANCLHPGVIATKLLHNGWGSGGASLEEGARTSVFVATSPLIKGISGKYFVHSKEQRSSAISYDKKIQDRLWEISLQLTGIRDPFK
jgi:NAD(P)-dependent dehydrogenase (short-subunit alcohol dehydrogenase family)